MDFSGGLEISLPRGRTFAAETIPSAGISSVSLKYTFTTTNLCGYRLRSNSLHSARGAVKQKRFPESAKEATKRHSTNGFRVDERTTLPRVPARWERLRIVRIGRFYLRRRRTQLSGMEISFAGKKRRVPGVGSKKFLGKVQRTLFVGFTILMLLDGTISSSSCLPKTIRPSAVPGIRWLASRANCITRLGAARERRLCNDTRNSDALCTGGSPGFFAAFTLSAAFAGWRRTIIAESRFIVRE